jgi:cobalt/nickel transport system permease protein
MLSLHVRRVSILVRMAPALLVSAMLVLLRGLTVPGRPLVSIDLPLLKPFAVSLEGFVAGGELAVVVLAGVSLLLVLGLSTPLPALLSALRWYRVPSLLIDVGMLMYRYLFLFVEETQRMRQAQRLRGPDVPWRRAMGGFNSMGANLLIRSYDRSQRVYDAQRLRGGERRP